MTARMESWFVVSGAIVGAIAGGVLVGFDSAIASFFAVIFGIICGATISLGIGLIVAQNHKSKGPRDTSGAAFYVGPVIAVIAAGAFWGCCFVPASWWNGWHPIEHRSDLQITIDRVKSEHPDFTDTQVRNLAENDLASQHRNADMALRDGQIQKEYREAAKQSLRLEGKDPDSFTGEIVHHDEVRDRANAIRNLDQAINQERN